MSPTAQNPQPLMGLLAGQHHARRPSLLVATLSMHLLGLALPLLSLQVYDRIIRHHATDTLVVLMAGVVVAICMETTLRILRQSIIAWQEAQFCEHAHTQCLAHILALDSQAAATLSPAETVQQLSAIERLKGRYGGESYLAWVELLFLLLYLALLGWLAGLLMLVPLVLVLGFATFGWRLGLRLQRTLRQLESQDDKRYGLLTEIFGALHSIKASGRELSMLRRYEALQARGTLLTHRATFTSLELSSLGQLTSQCMLLSMMSYGAWLTVHGRLSVGALIACVLLAGRLMQPVQRMLGWWARWQEEKIALRRLDHLAGLPIHPIQPVLSLADSLPSANGHLQVNALTFAYPGQEPLLTDISFQLQPGRVMALQAGISHGTTTLLRVLGGQLMPQHGQVQLDGLNLSTLPDHVLSERVAYLSTESLILRGTVMENLTAFQAQRRAEAVWIAEQLGMLPAITRLPGGWETQLEGGEADTIPPGLKQRITMARALLPKPKLILFDQADRALDTDGYNAVFRLLGKLKGRATLVLVSEDANLLRLADQRYALMGGQLVAVEDFAALRPHTLMPMQRVEF